MLRLADALMGHPSMVDAFSEECHRHGVVWTPPSSPIPWVANIQRLKAVMSCRKAIEPLARTARAPHQHSLTAAEWDLLDKLVTILSVSTLLLCRYSFY